MSTLDPDSGVEGLVGLEIASEVDASVRYRVVGRVGEGAMAVAFYGLRVTPDGERPVVIKIMRPAFVAQAGPTAALIVKKEAIALGRLNERVPATPFVVRFIDTGTCTVRGPNGPLDVPWIVVEYVHGGAEGTTLSDRVRRSLEATGYAFDAQRAAHAIECLTHGLVAVHEVGVVHRDVKPDNVLCCGFGDGEIFKIADFGVARPQGIATFHGIAVGTLGFVAPELLTQDPNAIGPWSDIFSLGCVIYYVLTGEELFAGVRTPADALVAAATPKRRSVREAAGLSPELRARELACRAIDYAIASATAAKIEARPQRADALAQLLVPWLRIESKRQSLIARRLDHLQGGGAESDRIAKSTGRFTWTTMAGQLRGRILRSVAWDGDGRCMAATSAGLSFWNGATWTDASLAGYPNPTGIRFVQRVAAGHWLVGGDEGMFATYTTDGISDVQQMQRGAGVRFERLSGDLADIAVLVGSSREAPPTLHALVAQKRWLKPLALDGIAAIAGICRIEEDKFLLVGRRSDGRGTAAIYTPCEWHVEWLDAPEVRAFIACAGNYDRGVGIAAGAAGTVLWREGGVVHAENVGGDFDLSAAAIDATGRGFAASAGCIFHRRPLNEAPPGAPRWETAWSDPSFRAPIVSLFADVARVIALAPDGAIVEGR
jgi:serine/threonine protein kinase